MDDHHSDHDTPPADKPRKSKGWLIVLLLLAAAGGGYYYYEREKPKTANAPPPPAPPVPVITATVKASDVPIYLTGLGTAQASQSVTLKVRVDGQINKIGFTEGALVKEGDLIAQIDPRTFEAQLQQAQAQKSKDEALLANAQADLERFSSLLKSDYASRQSVDTQKSLVAQYTAAVRSDEAMINYQKTQLSFTTIKSPITGIAGVRLIDEGNIVRATDANGIVVITQIEPISALFTVPQDALDNLRGATRDGEVKILAFARGDSKPRAEGTLTVIDNQIDQATGSLHLKATFPNADHSLWPGQFLTFKVLVRTRANAMTVPATAVQRSPQGTSIYIVKEDGTVDIKPVKVAQSIDNVALIDSGLQVGDVVVVDGQYKLKPGVKVKSQNDQTAAAEVKPAGTKQ
ncbi:MAG: efflux RND transporter periplasmic adaptor subunit [Beijerinckiaceae bacterium]|nr:efflux RND transporter periplasmic adaptor subunit [Beijerinckiaceae bacterium]